MTRSGPGKTPNRSVRIPDSTWKNLGIIARERHITRSEAVRRALYVQVDTRFAIHDFLAGISEFDSFVQDALPGTDPVSADESHYCDSGAC